ncbi:polyprenyl synthetase family protein [Microbacterium sp. NPDC055910]|uniref:polyprenyl synthetase family protein n=1 Tax=Microbacterium sp. NPDC055910 TaxID=3345659 RepID=UPI0035D7070F
MIGVASHIDVDAPIDEALARLRTRALGPGFDALAAAVSRAARGGKRMRPRLVAASFEAFGGDAASTPALAPVAAAFELLHAAFVVHDDVIDHDIERRGVPNVAGEFRARALDSGADATGAALLGDTAGILAGDILLHEASRLVALAGLPPPTLARIYDLLDDAVHVSAAGELADVENSVTGGQVPSSTLLDTAHDKTAVYSFRAPLGVGAILAGAPDDARQLLQRIGGRLGLAYQLVDDLIGAFGDETQAGRAIGGDLREAKQTPLVALARDTAQWTRVSDALALAHTGPIAVRDAQLALEASGARDSLRELIADTLAGVRFSAGDAVLPPRVGTLLRELADRVEERVP